MKKITCKQLAESLSAESGKPPVRYTKMIATLPECECEQLKAENKQLRIDLKACKLKLENVRKAIDKQSGSITRLLRVCKEIEEL